MSCDCGIESGVKPCKRRLRNLKWGETFHNCNRVFRLHRTTHARVCIGALTGYLTFLACQLLVLCPHDVDNFSLFPETKYPNFTCLKRQLRRTLDNRIRESSIVARGNSLQIHHLPDKFGKEKSIDRMASSDRTPPTKGTCNKAMSRGQCAAAQDIGPQDQVQHLIAFASTILNILVKSEKSHPL